LTSAYDMALVLRAALAMPRFVAYDRMPTATLPAQPGILDARTLQNQNAYLFAHVPGALVAKTGFTDAAQHTFAGAFEQGGRRLGVILLRAQRYPLDQWQQAQRLADWGFALPAGDQVGTLVAPRPADPAPPARSSPRPAAAAPGRDPVTGHTWWPAGGGVAVVLALAAAWTLRERRSGRRARLPAPGQVGR
ncbi:MAG: D-alanyl-D-alanine carboxypeptidase, partial [Jatrophihabitans sp.]